MNKAHLIILSLTLNLLLSVKAEAKQCGEETIDNCKDCGKFESIYDSCGTCQDNHFPLMDNLLCIACNDPLYGQAACEGNCDSSEYITSSNVLCDNCIEGYYSLNGLCYRCNIGNEGCKKCTYLPENINNDTKIFKCQECISSEYKLEENACRKCGWSDIESCSKCHFEGADLHPVCDECNYNYYVNPQKTCTYCKYKSINGGHCYICSEDENNLFATTCSCDQYYVKSDNYTCASCPSNCGNCRYNKDRSKTECYSCFSGYALDYSEGTCLKCEDGCGTCHLNEDKTTVCTQCTSGKLMPDGSKCLVCPEGCDYDCDYNPTTQKSVCNSCNLDYAFNPNTKECIRCNSVEEIGVGCSTCRYNTTNNNIQCLSCSNYYPPYYVYVTNKFKCLSSRDSSKVGLYGCQYALYVQGSDKFECTQCHSDYIPVITDKSCIDKGTNGLSNVCIEAEKIEDKYSCTKCDPYYPLTMVDDQINGIKNCFERSGEFSFCSEGKIETDGTRICTKCDNNAHLTEAKNCSCNSDSFNKNTNYCYKCNDENQGNLGCDISAGCTYTKANDELRCNQCIKGYFEYTKGQCYKCSNEIYNCYECHMNANNNKLLCDSCLNAIYSVNSNNRCGINDCQEYPEISPGCLICKDGLNDYLPNKKCQSCKYGYFKTKDEQCVYCKSEKYGGPACYECGYEGDNIVCKSCNLSYTGSYQNSYYYDKDLMNYRNVLLSSDGKCFNCQTELSENCQRCQFFKNNDGSESLKCIICHPAYYLSEEGICVNYTSLVKRKERCLTYNYLIANMNFTLSADYYKDYVRIGSFITDNYYYYYDDDYYSFNSTHTYKDINGQIESKCTSCDYNYYLNDNEICEKITLDKCIFLSVLQNIEKLGNPCRTLCYSYVIISLPFYDDNSNEGNQKSELLSIEDIYYPNSYYKDYLDYFKMKYGDSSTLKTCVDSSEETFSNLKHCQKAIYIQSNDSYICQICNYDYILDNNTNLCKLKEKNDNDLYYNKENYCKIIKKGDQEKLTYTCEDSWKMNITFTLVTFENNQMKFFEAKGELEGCSEANGESIYINPLYNCTKCYYGYALYYSKFYGRFICQNMKMKIMRKQEIAEEAFEEVETKVEINRETQKCDKDYLFTPDKKYCYKCDAEGIGSPGCKGKCSFSTERNNVIKCESQCKSEYIESSEGVCRKCEEINEGCFECHYENDTQYPEGYSDIKRKRNFVCDFCLEGYIKSSSGECLSCQELVSDKSCIRCEFNQEMNNYTCTKCEDDYFLDETGECKICRENKFKSLNADRCSYCYNTNEGGIENCLYCESDGEKVTCNQCFYGYILLTNNNSCLEILKNKELQKFGYCNALTLDNNNKFVCSKCIEGYTLVDNTECIFTPTLYDTYFSSYHRIYFYNTYHANSNSSKVDYYYINGIYEQYKENDFIYLQNKDLYPCQEAKNIGEKDNPLYSCTKCYDNYIRYGQDQNPVKITEENSGVSFCLYRFHNKDLDNCVEATYKIIDGKEVFNCTQCLNKAILAYNKYTNTHFCRATNITNKCTVVYCKNCDPNNGYICDECITDYEKNSVSGSCVKKTEVVPAVTWKDIYKLEMNGQKIINNQYIYGPSLRMVGITSSQINSRHAFLIYLTFKLRVSTRNLEENGEIKMPGICEVLEGVDETSNDVNLVEYECIGNSTTDEDLDNYQIDNIESGNEDNNFIRSNLNDLVADMKEKGTLSQITKTTSDFTYEDLIKIVIFQMNQKIDSIEANKFKFNFKIEGTLNKNIVTEKVTLTKDFDLIEIDKKANCRFTINPDSSADLSCELDVKDYKDIKTFSFKTAEINTEKNDIYLAKLNDIVLINSEEKEKDKKTVMIIIIVICSVVGAALIGVGIFFLVRKLRAPKNIKLPYNTNFNAPGGAPQVVESGERVIRYS